MLGSDHSNNFPFSAYNHFKIIIFIKIKINNNEQFKIKQGFTEIICPIFLYTTNVVYVYRLKNTKF